MKNVLSDIKHLALSVVPAGGAAWLYGSRARGTAHRHSDWDVLLILRKDTLTQADYDTVSYPF
ncbi:MAG: nucleotidyltransferase domain-containing protein, partial [Bacteroidales bacterium]|nr:nucleotidyltransferase domain-containing protein [Bacteroidales bacterium]